MQYNLDTICESCAFDIEHDIRFGAEDHSPSVWQRLKSAGKTMCTRMSKVNRRLVFSDDDQLQQTDSTNKKTANSG